MKQPLSSILCSMALLATGVGDALGEGLTGYYYQRARRDGPVVAGPHSHKAVDRKIDFATTTWDWQPFGMTEQFSVKWTGWLYIEKGGPYVFATFSESGSSLYLDDMKVLNNRSGRQGPTWTSGSLLLGEGYHKIEIVYFHWKESSGMGLYWDKGEGPEIIPGAVLFPEEFSPPRFNGASVVSENERQ